MLLNNKGVTKDLKRKANRIKRRRDFGGATWEKKHNNGMRRKRDQIEILIKKSAR